VHFQRPTAFLTELVVAYTEPCTKPAIWTAPCESYGDLWVWI